MVNDRTWFRAMVTRTCSVQISERAPTLICVRSGRVLGVQHVRKTYHPHTAQRLHAFQLPTGSWGPLSGTSLRSGAPLRCVVWLASGAPSHRTSCATRGNMALRVACSTYMPQSSASPRIVVASPACRRLPLKRARARERSRSTSANRGSPRGGSAAPGPSKAARPAQTATGT